MPITLTNPITISQGTTVIQDDSMTAVTAIANIDMIGNDIIFLLQNGAMSGSAFVLDNLLSQNNDVTLDLVAGGWTDNNNHSGTCDPNTLATINSQIKALVNTLEALVITGGIVAGTETPWS